MHGKTDTNTKERISLKNEDKSIDDVDFTANLDIIETSNLELDMPMSSKEFKERISL